MSCWPTSAGSSLGPGTVLAGSEFRAAFGVIEIHLPGLADRKDEWPRLLAAALEAESASMTPKAEAGLAKWPWPGTCGNCGTWSAGRPAGPPGAGSTRPIFPWPCGTRRPTPGPAQSASRVAMPKLDEVLEQVERRLIDLALRKTKGDQTAAADLLGVYRSRLVRRLKSRPRRGGREGRRRGTRVTTSCRDGPCSDDVDGTGGTHFTREGGRCSILRQ